MQWTTSQYQAIHEDGKNIIVSAGAGSGKTAVLTERVIRKLKQGVSINQLLILTFTNAAAAEMKKRIRDKILKEPSLFKELNLLESAPICTFDSYALSLVSKYHYILNIKKDVSILDEAIVFLEMKKELDNIFDSLYQEKDSDFLKTIADFCVKDDNLIKNAIIDIYKKLNLRLDKEEYLQEYISYYYQDRILDNYLNQYLKLIKLKINEVYELLSDLSNYDPIEYASNMENALRPIFDANSYEEIKDAIESFTSPRLPNNSSAELKQAKDRINKHLQEIKTYVRYESLHEVKKYLLETIPYTKTIIKVIKKLDNYLDKLKSKYDSYTFLDIAKMAYMVVKKNDQIRFELKHQFNEIMIDEYQDTSDIQEAFINLIANNNVYMVGDLKQSIYRFRNANPYIFKEKYEKYRKEIQGIKIDLAENFRSRREVVEDINIIFNNLMTDDFGGVDYNRDGKMIFGNKQYEVNKPNQSYHYEVYNYFNFLDKGYSKPEVEALIIAQDIQKKVGKIKVFDKGNYREANYSDFVILIDRSKDFTLYKRIFESHHIPLNIIEDETLTNENDLFVIKNIMKFIIKIKKGEFDTEFKYLFISIARSFISDLNDDEIFSYFLNNNFHDSKIYKDSLEIVKILDTLSNKEFLKLIIDTFKFYERIILIGDIESFFVRLEYLMRLADALASNGYSVYDFPNYLSEMIDNDLNITYSLDKSSNNGVKIMTIHKSKGLEFPFCYYSGLSSTFNSQDLKTHFIYDDEYGIICPYFHDGINDTILKDLYKHKTLQEDLSEKVRLLYVALTRCKEQFILLLDIDPEKNTKTLNSFKDFLLQVPLTNIKNLNVNDYHITYSYKQVKKSNYQDYIKQVSPIIVQELNIPKVKVEKKKYSKSENVIRSIEEKEKLDFGTKLHYLLEIIDFKNPHLDSYHLEPIIKKKLNSFFHSDLLQNIANANIYKEYEFIYQDQHGIIDLILEYDNYLVVIDYKTKNIDDEAYLKQVEGYKEYLEIKTKKHVYAYLYSLIDEKYKQVGVEND